MKKNKVKETITNKNQIETMLILEPTEIIGRRKLKVCPRDPDDQNKLGDELVEWIKNTETCVLSDFPLSRSFGPSRFYKIADYNEYFADCLDYARHKIASRLQHGWEDKTLEREYAVRWLPIYDEKFRDLTLQKHRMTEEIRQGVSSSFNITIPSISEHNSEDSNEKQ